MPRKTIIIFIIVFIIVGIVTISIFSSLNKKNETSTETENNTPWYQDFNPFGTGDNIVDETPEVGTENKEGETEEVDETQTSRFYQITDFAISGATLLDETRQIVTSATQPEQVKIIIDANTREGRREIQGILNETLSLNPPLVVDGVFGKKAIQAIKDFQELKNITITGIIDEETAPYFTKTADPEKPLFEQVPSVRFVERTNGHIYKMFLDTKVKEKISNSTIPSIYEAFFNNKGDTVIYRYLSSENIINSFIATLGAPKGEFLPQNISDLSVSADKNKFFYLIENANGVTGTIGTFGETKRELVFNSPFTEWLSQWDTKGRIFLTTKSSYDAPGSIFILNATNKTISKIFGGVMGLTTLISPNGSYILYSSYTDTGPKLGVFDISKHSTKDLEMYGLSEKCVWSSDNTNIYCAVPNVIDGNKYPDVWYQGLVSFNDFFIKMNVLTGERTTIINSTNEKPVDAINLILNKEEDLLFFTNKKDLTLWSLDISN